MLARFSSTYWLYLLGSACVYGAVVPFWFIGAKVIAQRWGMSLVQADTFLLLPEGGIALIAPPLGMLVDRQRWSLRRRLTVSAASLALIPGAHLALAWLALPPVLPVAALAIGYGCAQNLVWASIALVTPPGMIDLSAGLVGCAVNVLPALLPAAVLQGDGRTDLSVLAVAGLMGVAAFLAAAWCATPTTDERARRRPRGGSCQSRDAGLAAVVPQGVVDEEA